MQYCGKQRLVSNLAINIIAGALGGGLVVLLLVQGSLFRSLVPDVVRNLPEPEESGQHSLGSTAPRQETITPGADTVDLQNQLDSAAEERAQLASTVLALNRRIADLESQLALLVSAAPVDEADTATGEGSGDDLLLSGPAAMDSGRHDFGNNRTERNYEYLLAAGIDEQTARDLKARNDQYQLSRLELFDQAAREGWDESEQLSERLQALNESRPNLREELGDDAYDRYLYASGSPNRVVIDAVIPGSAADQAGLQPGDLISSYAGERVFRAQELQQATRSGSRGESVQLLFERSGQTLSTALLRGPMGVTLRSTRQQP